MSALADHPSLPLVLVVLGLNVCVTETEFPFGDIIVCPVLGICVRIDGFVVTSAAARPHLTPTT